ncbi:MAG: hypothetical protein RL215_2659 [Planctomycetota bacterium]
MCGGCVAAEDVENNFGGVSEAANDDSVSEFVNENGDEYAEDTEDCLCGVIAIPDHHGGGDPEDGVYAYGDLKELKPEVEFRFPCHAEHAAPLGRVFFEEATICTGNTE